MTGRRRFLLGTLSALVIACEGRGGSDTGETAPLLDAEALDQAFASAFEGSPWAGFAGLGAATSTLLGELYRVLPASAALAGACVDLQIRPVFTLVADLASDPPADEGALADRLAQGLQLHPSRDALLDKLAAARDELLRQGAPPELPPASARVLRDLARELKAELGVSRPDSLAFGARVALDLQQLAVDLQTSPLALLDRAQAALEASEPRDHAAGPPSHDLCADLRGLVTGIEEQREARLACLGVLAQSAWMLPDLLADRPGVDGVPLVELLPLLLGLASMALALPLLGASPLGAFEPLTARLCACEEA